MTAVVLLQARVNSNRLPGKVLLPIGGLPMFALAAHRAANTGLKVIMVTSDQKTDDILEYEAKKQKIDCFRGDLQDVLGRFTSALESYPDSTVVVRLTADNVFPDGSLIDELIDKFVSGDLDYLVCGGKDSGLPYGVSAEITRLSHLRSSNSRNLSDSEREHVTTDIRKRFDGTAFLKYSKMKLSGARCTVDTLDDYMEVALQFRNISDPVGISMTELVQGIEESQEKKILTEPFLVLGGAQFGLDYGVTNKQGMLSVQDIKTIIELAEKGGVKYIDTAQAYGDSERNISTVVGQLDPCRISAITKIHMPDVGVAKTKEDSELEIKKHIKESIHHLKNINIDCIMFHRAEYVIEKMEYIDLILSKLVDKYEFESFGVSIQNPEELLSVLEINNIKKIQLPFNILDWRWKKHEPLLISASKDRGIEFHARSTFLQGLVFSTDEEIWRKARIKNSAACIEWLIDGVKSTGLNNISELCLSYVKSQAWVSGVVVGVSSADELKQNLGSFGANGLSSVQIDMLETSRPCIDIESLNPANWSK